MKKIFLFCLICLLTVPVFADLGIVDGIMDVVSYNLDKKKVAVQKEESINIYDISNIEEKVMALPDDTDFEAYYNINKMEVARPVFLNLVAGFGKGSKMQYRYKSYGVESLIDSLALGIGVGGAALILIVDFGAEVITFGTKGDSAFQIAMISAGVGLSISLVNRIISAIRADAYGQKFNKKLRDNIDMRIALNPVSNDVSLVGKVSL